MYQAYWVYNVDIWRRTHTDDAPTVGVPHSDPVAPLLCQGGTSASDYVTAAAMGSDGSSIYAGQDDTSVLVIHVIPSSTSLDRRHACWWR